MYADFSKKLNLEFEKIKSISRIGEYDSEKQMFSYYKVSQENKFSQIFLADKGRLFLNDFWRDGVCLARGRTTNINELALALDCWLNNDISTEKFSTKFPTVKPYPKAKAFDENREVEYTWNLLLNDQHDDSLHDFVKVAINDKILGKLFPFTSHRNLCFSRCTGYPYTYDLPIISPMYMKKGFYEVKTYKNKVIGKGIAVDVLKVLKNNLPKDIKPAIRGTAKDLKKSS